MEHEGLEQQVRAIADAHREIQETVGRYVVGNRELVDLVVIGVLTGGHVLIDGVPGTAKTTISKIVARLIGYQFNRVQGAVDVQPADIIGVRIFDAEKHEFVLQKGPIFANFVMIDEINRLTPKTQSAFIEAMAEGQATIDGLTYPLGDPFFVIATQNTQEFEGTFPLIEAQRDRFNYSMTLFHLEAENESEILQAPPRRPPGLGRLRQPDHPAPLDRRDPGDGPRRSRRSTSTTRSSGTSATS